MAPEKRDRVIELLREGRVQDEIARLVGVSSGYVGGQAAKLRLEEGEYRRKSKPDLSQTIPESSEPLPFKKNGEFDLDEWLDWMESGQALRKKASYTQHDAVIELGDGKTPQIVCPQGDWHIASWGTDHKLLRDTIKEIDETENAHFPLMGDMIQMSIKMRSVLEVSDNLIPPELQAQFLEKLLDKIMHKVPFSVWCNHGVEREEKQSGISMVKHILSRRTVYFNGIGHPDIKVGDEIYRWAVSHKWRGSSMYDTAWGNRRYARMEANDREIVWGADNHRPGFATYYEGGMKRTVGQTGTFQTGSGYAQRYFSLRTWPIMPCVVLYPDVHRVVPFENLDQALQHIGQ